MIAICIITSCPAPHRAVRDGVVPPQPFAPGCPRTLRLRLLYHIRQQAEKARAFDCLRQLSLFLGRNCRDATWNDLAALRNISLQQLHVLVVDLRCISAREWTSLAAAEEWTACAALWRECHGLFLPSVCVGSFRVVAFIAPSASAAVVAPIAPIAVAVRLSHHCGRTILKRIDTDREIAEHIFVQTFLTLDFVERGRRRINIEQSHVRFTVLANAVGEGLQAPVFVFGDLA